MHRLPFPPMPSGKRARQQRQQAATAAAPPPVRSKSGGGTRQRQASPRALAIAGGVVLAIAIVVVLGIVLVGGGGSSNGTGVISSSDMKGLPATGSQSSDVALPGAAEANNLFKGIPQNGLVLGDPKAPVTMEMFIDVQCPVCQNYETLNLPTVVNKYIKTGQVQLHLKPWAFLGGTGSQSFTGRLGLIAAAKQNKGFQYAKVLYDNQGQEESGWLTGAVMATIAANVNGLNMSQWKDDTNSSGPPATAKAVDKLAAQKKVQGTPTIFVGCTGSKLQNVTAPGSAPTLQETEQAINSANCG
jgi:protein-disulfide isomerase